MHLDRFVQIRSITCATFSPPDINFICETKKERRREQAKRQIMDSVILDSRREKVDACSMRIMILENYENPYFFSHSMCTRAER